MRLATDPRDKVYGLLGLAPEELDGLISLDYAADVERVFETFTVEYVQCYKNLGLLSSLGGQRRLPNLPSFCPDWTIRPGNDASNDETMMVQVANRIAVQQFHCASGVSKATWRRIGPGAIAANGFVFDEIRDVSPECWRQSQERRRQWAKDVRALAGHLETRTFLKALCGELTFSVERQIFEPVRDGEGDVEGRLEKWWKWILSGENNATRDKDVISVEQAVFTISAGRSFAVTQKGYIGYADQHCRPGHVVSILGGGHTPFVLAPTLSGEGEPRHRVIGDAYIYGIMQGEAFGLAARQADQLEEIILI